MEHFDFIAQLWNREGKMEELESSEIIIEENDEREELEEEEDIFGFPKELLDTPIDSLDLTKRAKNCLKREKIDTLRDLLKKKTRRFTKNKKLR